MVALESGPCGEERKERRVMFGDRGEKQAWSVRSVTVSAFCAKPRSDVRWLETVGGTLASFSTVPFFFGVLDLLLTTSACPNHLLDALIQPLPCIP